MAPTRKSRSVNKRFLYPNEVSPIKDGDSTSKSNKRKRKVSDMLGPQWSKEDLQCFYEAYRRYGKDWKKVAAAVRNRTVEMVEALYTMNRAYLSLPEGTASVVGLIAMMTDHYSVLEGSESEQESNDGVGLSHKPQKRARGKPYLSTIRGSDRQYVADISHTKSVASAYGCLSLLKKRRSGDQPRAVGKRTPRIPVRYTHDKDSAERYASTSNQGLNPKLDDDDETHKAALVLAEASHRGGSPQVSQTPTKRREASAASPSGLGERLYSESEMTSAKNIGNEMDDDGCEGSLGSTEGNNNFSREKPRAGRKSFGTLVQQKAKKSYGKKLEIEVVGHGHGDDIKEACSGTEEQKFSSFGRKPGAEFAEVTFAQSSGQASKRRTKKVLFGGDEGVALDALQALADLSLMMPATPAEEGSSGPLKKEKKIDIDKSRAGEAIPDNQQRIKPKCSPSKKKGDKSVLNTRLSESTERGKAESLDSSPKDTGIRRKKPKSSVSKVAAFEVQMDSSEIDYQRKELPEQGKVVNKSRRSFHTSPQQQIGQLVRIPEHSSSSTDVRKEVEDSVLSSVQVPGANKINLPSKTRSRRKLDKSLVQRNKKDLKFSEGFPNDQSAASWHSYPHKEKLINCLSNYRVRRWCVYEWFYSAIDYPWFAKSEFVEYLYHVGLGHVPRLTRVEWDVIRSSLGKPRRFSDQFLREEKEKLNYYRDSVRNHYAELRMGKREGLPTDLARPLTVGQRVIAIHPRSREVHDGNVLTVDHDRCRIQFDRPELGVEFVKDIDCMPLNPTENMPASLKRQNIAVDKFYEALKQFKVSEASEDRTKKEFIRFAPTRKMEEADGSSDVALYLMNTVPNSAKEGFVSPNSHVKCFNGNVVSPQHVVVSPQQVVTSQQSSLSQMQAKEADIRALAELSRALDKKHALVTELNCLNDDVSEDSPLKDVDSFKKQYAAVVVQLNEVLEQVSSALMCLRQRNTYQGNYPLPWHKPTTNSDDGSCLISTINRLPCDSRGTDSHICDIVETSKVKARKMVDAAIKAVSSLKDGLASVQKIEDALDFVNNRLCVDDSKLPLPTAKANGSLACLSSPASFSIKQEVNLRSDAASIECEHQIPSELIMHCVATLLMIQKCTERQFPPAVVAQILDFAATSLQPYCSQNLPLYAEIQKCVGIIRSQILALVPT